MTPLLGLAFALLLGGGLSLSDGDGTRSHLLITAVFGPGLLVVAGRVAWAGHGRAAMIVASVGVGLWAMAQTRVADLRAWHPPALDVAALEQRVTEGALVTVEGVLRHDAARTPTGALLDLRVDRLTIDGETVETAVGMRLSVAGALLDGVVEQWTRGRRVRAPVGSLRRPQPYRNFGVPDAEREAARRHVRLFGTIKSAALVTATPGPWWEEAAAVVRAHVRHAVRAHVDAPDAVAVIVAILIGDRTGLPAEQEQRLQRAGTYHVIAISGGNVAVWLGALAWVPRWRRAGVRTGTALLALGLLAFAWCVDGGASVARASSVAAVWLLARWWDLRVTPAQALAAAAAWLVALDPLTLYDPGFLLSFGATSALVALATLWRSGPRSRPDGVHLTTTDADWWRTAGWVPVRAIGLVMLATAAVDLVLLPVGASWFSLVTGIGLVANLAALPAMAMVQALGLLLVALDAVGADGSATLAGRVAASGVHVLLGSANLVDWLPWLVRFVAPPAPAACVGYYIALTAAVVTWRWGTTRAATLVAAASSAVVLVLLFVIVSGTRVFGEDHPWQIPGMAAEVQTTGWARDRWLTVTVLDVGQGDATVIRFPDGVTWLVDAGGTAVGSSFDVGARVTAPALWALGVRRLDRLVITHGDADHAAGAPGVLARLPVRELLAGIPVPDDPVDAALLQAAAGAGAAVRLVRAGENLSRDRVHVRVLHPPAPEWSRVKVRNDDSVALWVRLGLVGILLPGDAGQEVEGAWTRQVARAPITIVRAGHHGSRTSTGPALLTHFAPDLLVTSSGRGNRFGHPHPLVVQRARRQGALVLGTHTSGAIQVATNGRVAVVRTAVGDVHVLHAPAPNSDTRGRPKAGVAASRSHAPAAHGRRRSAISDAATPAEGQARYARPGPGAATSSARRRTPG